MTIREFYTLVGGSYDDMSERFPSDALILRFLTMLPQDGEHGAACPLGGRRGRENRVSRGPHAQGRRAQSGLDRARGVCSEMTEALRGSDTLPASAPALFEAVQREYDKVTGALAQLTHERHGTAARIELMDALRGLAVCLMVLHHFLYDLCAFLGAPWWLFTNPVFDVLHYFFAGLFIFLYGISSDFSRSNLKRGAKAMALALGITLVTYFMNMTIVFGVLHLLASCMLLFGLTRGFWEALPAWVLPGPLSRAHLPHRALRGRRDHADAAAVALRLHHARLRLGGLFPAAAVVLRVPARHLGRALCQGGRLPQWFYTAKAPRLALVGRHALLLYVLHQPLLYALTMLLRLIFIR